MTRLWTIYRRPRDYPMGYVVREFVAEANGPMALKAASVAATLNLARAAVPPGAVRLDRSPGDDPVIVETWV